MKKLFCVAGIFVLGIGFLFAQEQKTEEMRLSLHECLEMALEQNLDISVSAIDPEILEFSLRRSKEFFWPRLTIDYANWRRNQLGTWWVQGTEYTTNTNNYNFGVEQNIVTG